MGAVTRRPHTSPVVPTGVWGLVRTVRGGFHSCRTGAKQGNGETTSPVEPASLAPVPDDDTGLIGEQTGGVGAVPPVVFLPERSIEGRDVDAFVFEPRGVAIECVGAFLLIASADQSERCKQRCRVFIARLPLSVRALMMGGCAGQPQALALRMKSFQPSPGDRRGGVTISIGRVMKLQLTRATAAKGRCRRMRSRRVHLLN